MTVKSKQLVLVCILILIAFAFCFLTVYIYRNYKLASLQIDDSRFGLIVPIDELSLGDIYYTDSLEHNFTIFNNTDNAIVIDKWLTSCNCTVVEPDRLVIGKKSSAQIKGKISIPKLMKNSDFRIPVLLEVLYVPCISGLNEPELKIENGWVFQANVNPIANGPRAISLGSASVLSNVLVSTFQWEINNDFELTSCICTDKKISTCRLHDSPQKLKIEFSTKSMPAIGEYSGFLCLDFKHKHKPGTYSLSIFFKYNIVPDVFVYPKYPVLQKNEGDEYCSPIELRFTSLTGSAFVLLPSSSEKNLKIEYSPEKSKDILVLKYFPEYRTIKSLESFPIDILINGIHKQQITVNCLKSLSEDLK